MADPSIATVIAVLTGRAVPFTRPGSRSAIVKTPVTGRVHCGALGLENDEQGDRRVHGGPDKAVHLYPQEHYARWRNELGPHPLLEQPGAFGENLALRGIVEPGICLGDRFRVGTALLEVSQGRQPCWKLSDRFGVPTLAARVQETRRAGWYCRVLEAGYITAGDTLELMERPFPDWNIDRLLRVVFERHTGIEETAEAARLPLPPSWARLLEQRVNQSEESSAPRLEGPNR